MIFKIYLPIFIAALSNTGRKPKHSSADEWTTHTHTHTHTHTYINTMEYFSALKKEGSPEFHINMNKPGGYCAK
jgi:hypothetical protein